MQLEYGSTYQLSNVPFTHPPAPPTSRTESYDAMDYLAMGGGRYDPLNGYDLQAGLYPSTILGSRTNRMYGRNRYQFWTERQLLLQRDAARWLGDNDPLAIGVINQLVNFTAGEECQVTASPKKGLDVDDGVLNLVQSRIEAFKERVMEETGGTQTFEEWCRAYCREAVIDGEKINRIYCTPRGGVVRQIDPEQVTQPPGGTDQEGWHMGVLCEKGDITKRLGYYVTYEPGGAQGELVESRDVVFYKRNTPETVVRGVSDLLPVTDDLADIGRLIDGIRVGAKVKSKIAYIRSLKGATQSVVEDFVRKTGDTLPGASPVNVAGSGKQQVTRETNPPGTVVNAGDNMQISMLPQGATQEYIEAANFCIRVVMAQRWGLPEYMVSADASNNNYASIMVAGGPSVRAFKANQSEIAARIRMIIVRVLEIDMALGKLPMGVLEAVQVVVKFPSPVISDPLAEAQVNQIHLQNEIISKEHWQANIGVDPGEMNEQIMQERERDGIMVAGLPDMMKGLLGDDKNGDKPNKPPE